MTPSPYRWPVRLLAAAHEAMRASSRYITKGRSTKPNLKVGICGEHGGDPESVIFCHKVGMNYVSCSPYRVPIALLAAAHAALADQPGVMTKATTA